MRPEKYDNAILKRDVVHDVNAHRSDSLRVNVYTREKRVRLFINNKVIGEKDVDPTNYTASFFVAYEPGELKAEVVGKKGEDNQIVFRTSKAPYAIEIEPACPELIGNNVISSSHNSLAYFNIKVVDEEGNLCPTAELPLEIKTSGAKHFVTAGTGHPYDMKSFRSLTPTTFRGQAVVIIQPQGEIGTVELSVSSPKLKNDEKISVVIK